MFLQGLWVFAMFTIFANMECGCRNTANRNQEIRHDSGRYALLTVMKSLWWQRGTKKWYEFQVQGWSKTSSTFNQFRSLMRTWTQGRTRTGSSRPVFQFSFRSWPSSTRGWAPERAAGAERPRSPQLNSSASPSPVDPAAPCGTETEIRGEKMSCRPAGCWIPEEERELLGLQLRKQAFT